MKNTTQKFETQVFFGPEIDDTDFIYRKEVPVTETVCTSENGARAALHDELEEIYADIFHRTGGQEVGYGFEISPTAFEAPAGFSLIAETIAEFSETKQIYMNADASAIVILQGATHTQFYRREASLSSGMARRLLTALSSKELPVSEGRATKVFWPGFGTIPAFSSTYAIHHEALDAVIARQEFRFDSLAGADEEINFAEIARQMGWK